MRRSILKRTNERWKERSKERQNGRKKENKKERKTERQTEENTLSREKVIDPFVHGHSTVPISSYDFWLSEQINQIVGTQCS